jgi:hypothetical protein
MQTATIIGIEATSGLTTSLANIGNYVVPVSTSAVISHLFVANKSGSPITASVYVYNGSTGYYLAYQAPIAVNDTLNLLGENGKITLATGWSIQASASSASVADASMSVTQFV